MLLGGGVEQQVVDSPIEGQRCDDLEGQKASEGNAAVALMCSAVFSSTMSWPPHRHCESNRESMKITKCRWEST